MRKTLTAAIAALTFGGAVAAAAVPAQARGYQGGGYQGGGYYNGDYRQTYRNNDAGTAIAAGIVGLALGAALTSGSHASYGSYGYAQPYYGGSSYNNGYYGGGYRTCESRRWVYDRYTGRQVPVISRYAC